MSMITSQQARTVQAHHAGAVVGADGTLHLRGLPFAPGTSVEVLVLEDAGRESSVEVGSLYGTVTKDVDPFAPAVPADEWDANA